MSILAPLHDADTSLVGALGLHDAIERESHTGDLRTKTSLDRRTLSIALALELDARREAFQGLEDEISDGIEAVIRQALNRAGVRHLFTDRWDIGLPAWKPREDAA